MVGDGESDTFTFEAEEQSFFFKSGIKAKQNHSRFAIDAY